MLVQSRRLGVGVAGVVLAVLPLAAQYLPSDSAYHEQVLFNGQVQIGPGRQYQIPFATWTNFRHARIAGNVQAAGGSGNDIRVLVVKNQSVVYDSGRRRSVVMSVDFSKPGQYVVIFDNSFSLVSAKAVAGRLSLVHWGVNVEENAVERAEAQDRYQRTVEIVGKLYDALKANERVWGTHQMFARPRVQLVNERTINAAAIPDNTIRVNTGLYDFADSLGDKRDDVLAAVMAHELSHLFYRHPGYGTGQGLLGIFDELRGVSALDRVQEQEADVLGVRLACQAGFDPEGSMILMRKFAERDPSASNFMRTHPTAIARQLYLQGEVAKCHEFQARARQAEGEAPARAVGTTSQANETSPAMATTTTTQPSSANNSRGTTLWKLAQSPNDRWKFIIDDQFLYGERVMPTDRAGVGDFDTVDAKRQGDRYVGTQRVRYTFKVQDYSAPEAYRLKACRWDFAVELISVTPNRIEGRWEGYPPNSRPDANRCTISGSRVWEDVTWIRVE
jgi:hypothetical protein